MERFIIEHDGEGVGILVREGDVYRFATDHPAVLHLDGKTFGAPQQLERVVAELLGGMAA